MGGIIISAVNKTRDYYFDNLKGILILLVILGNSIEYSEPESINTHFPLLLLYLFHMPMFAFISGYFCKKSNRSTQSKVIGIFKIYVSAQIFYTLLEQIIFKNTYVKLEFFSPQWTLWYLLSLIFWYIISDYIKDKRRWLVVTLCLSLYIGLDASVGSYVSISRTFFFLPCFIAGMAFEKEYLQKIKKWILPILFGSICIIGTLYIIKDAVPLQLFFEYTKYTNYFDTAGFPLFMRIFHYIGAALIGMCLLYIVPSCKMWISSIGRNSLILYIVHSGVTKLLYRLPFIKYVTPGYVLFSEIVIISTTIAISLFYAKFKEKNKLKKQIKTP